MNELESAVAEELPLESVGQSLRRAREEQGLSLPQVAAETRIPERHLETIENGNFIKLPAKTYAVGFSRTYARLVGMDEFDVAERVREELAAAEDARQARLDSFEPGDPGKIPSAGLAWFGLFAAILLAAGSFSFYSSYYGSGAGLAPLQPDTDPEIANAEAEGGSAETSMAPQQAARGDGQVVFTALEEGVWVRFYDAEGAFLLDKEMAIGERFEIPSDAEGPQIWTGRPDAFGITIDGRAVPKLAEDDFVMRDVAISAEALLARVEPVDVLPEAASVAIPPPQAN